MSRLITVSALLLAPLAVTACSLGDGGAPESTPDDAVVLTQNLPTPVAEHTVIATNVDDGRSVLVIKPPQSDSRRQQVTVGDEVVLGTARYAVEAIYTEGEERPEPGKGTGRVMLLPQG